MIKHRAVHFVLSHPTLQLRRKCTRLIIMYKLLNSLLSVPSNYLLAPSLITTTGSNHDFKLMHYQPSLDCYKYSLFPKTVPEWNTLPSNIVSEATLNKFKKLLYSYLMYSCILAFMPLVGVLINIIQPSTKNNKKCG